VRLTVDKNGMLQESSLELEVIQEYTGSGRGERISLGNVKLNLAEYVEQSDLGPSDDEDPGVTRRYLMKDSKINSTLKIGIYMRQTEGDKNYIAPALKTAQVFSGIAGIMAGEQAELEDSGGRIRQTRLGAITDCDSCPFVIDKVPRGGRTARHVPTHTRRVLVSAARRAQSRRVHRGHFRGRRRLGRPREAILVPEESTAAHAVHRGRQQRVAQRKRDEAYAREQQHASQVA
jgi:hypothetical protein